MINFYKFHKKRRSLYNYDKYAPALHRLVKYDNGLAYKMDFFHLIKHILKRDSYWGSWYAKNAMKERWPEAEPHIMLNRYDAANYCQYVIKDRWPEAEHVFGTPFWASWYAIDVIKGRWLEAEEMIKTDKNVWSTYCQIFGVEND